MRTLSVKGRVFPTNINHNSGLLIDRVASLTVYEITKCGTVTI